MRIAILALGSNGDVTPCAALGGALERAGHQVHLASHADFAELAAANHLEFHPIAPPVREMARKAGVSFTKMMRQYVDMAASVAKCLVAPGILQADLLLNQLPNGLFGRDIAESTGIPMIGLSYQPIVPTSAFPDVGWPRLAVPGYNLLSYRVSGVVLWSAFGKAVNGFRTECLGLKATSQREFLHTQYPVLAGFSPHLVPPPADWGSRVCVTGYWHAPDEQWAPSPELLRFLQDGPAPIFIGFGSMTIPDPSRAMGLLFDALEQTGLRAVLHSGWAGFSGPSLPEAVFPIDFAPYSWLFPRLAGLVIHGGAGIVHCAARSGVPVLVVPFLFDQFGWGKRLRELGAGPEPLPFKNLTTARLVDRLHRLTGDPPLKAGAQALSHRLESEDGLATAVAKITEWMQTGP